MKADSLTAPVRLTKPAAVPDGRRQGVGRHGHRHALQAVSVQNPRNLTRLPKPPVAVFSLGFTRLNS